MRTLAIINLKGGVAKTISSVNMAYIFAKNGERTLLIDNDKQGNTSKIMKRHDYEHKTVADMLIDVAEKKDFDISDYIQKTDYENLDIITANMELLMADKNILLEAGKARETRMRKALQQLEDRYEYCIIDNAPDINMTTINAMVAADDILVPVTIDRFAMDGLNEIKDIIEDAKEWNPDLKMRGCFITQYERQNEADQQGRECIEQAMGFHVLNTQIRRTPKVKQSTFAQQPIPVFSPRCGATRDYEKLVEEYYRMLEED